MPTLFARTLLTQRGGGSFPTQQGAALNGIPVTPADGTDLPSGTTRGLYVGAAGNINVNLEGGGTAVLTSLSTGQILNIPVSRVLATSTTATGIVALY